MDIAMKELVQMLTEWREQLHDGFVSGTIDFWTDSHRHEQCGSFVIDFPAEKYKFENGTVLFMSKKTKEGMRDGLLLTGESCQCQPTSAISICILLMRGVHTL